MRRSSSFAFLSLALLAPTGSSSPIEAEVQWAPTPACDFLLPPPVCILGYDPGPTPDVGDDTFYIHAVIQNATVRVQGWALLPPQHISIDHQSTSVRHPVFLHLEDRWQELNNTLPPEAKRYIDLQVRSWGLYGLVYPYRLLPVDLPGFDDDRAFGVIQVRYIDDLIERDAIYPLWEGGTRGPLETDEVLSNVSEISQRCLPEEQGALALVCEVRAAIVPAVAADLKAMLPNVSMNDGVAHAEVTLAAQEDSAWAVVRTYDVGNSAQPSGGNLPKWTAGDTVLPPGMHDAAAGSALRFGSPPATFGPDTRLSPADAAGASDPAASWWPLVAAGVALLLPALWLFHRITGKRALEHGTRLTLLALVEAHPGIQVGAAARALGLSHHTTEHHLEVLRRTGRVERVKAGRSVAMYPVGSVPLRHRTALVHLRRGPQAAMLALVARNPGQGLTALAALDGHRKSSVHAKLQRLMEQGLAAKDAQGGYIVTPSGAEALVLVSRTEGSGRPPKARPTAELVGS